MRMVTTRIVLLAVLATGGCGTDSATLPAPTGPPTTVGAPAAPVGLWNLWNLTTTLTSVTGPAMCGFDQRMAPGDSRSWLMDVSRSGTKVTLVYDVRNYPTDHLELVGSTDGEAFTAASVSWPVSFPCGGARVDYKFESHVAGQFSPDGDAITAKETWTYRLPSGDAVVLSFNWVAAQRPFGT